MLRTRQSQQIMEPSLIQHTQISQSSCKMCFYGALLTKKQVLSVQSCPCPVFLSCLGLPSIQHWQLSWIHILRWLAITAGRVSTNLGGLSPERCVVFLLVCTTASQWSRQLFLLVVMHLCYMSLTTASKRSATASRNAGSYWPVSAQLSQLILAVCLQSCLHDHDLYLLSAVGIEVAVSAVCPEAPLLEAACHATAPEPQHCAWALSQGCCSSSTGLTRA